MHELSIALNILDIASEESQCRGGVDVKAIHLRVGELSGVAKEALVSAFEIAREYSPFSSCVLLVENVPVTVFCKVCEVEQPAKSIQWMCCSQCGKPTADVISGCELEITAMEIEGHGAAAPTSLHPMAAAEQKCPSSTQRVVK